MLAFLTRFRIGTRLNVCFSIATLIIILLGVLGYLGTNRMLAIVKDTADSHARRLELAQGSRAEINALRRHEKEFLINIGDAAKSQEYRKKWDAALASFEAQNAAMVKLAELPREKELLADIKKQSDVYAAGFRKVYEDVQAGRITNTRDASAAMGEYKKATHEAENMVTELSKMMGDEMNNNIAEAEAGAAKIRLSIAVIAIIAAIMAVILSVAITRSITVPLSRLVDVAGTIATGDLSHDIEVTADDETGRDEAREEAASRAPMQPDLRIACRVARPQHGQPDDEHHPAEQR